MIKEKEVRILEIDEKVLEKIIYENGGEKIGEFLQKRYVYDFHPAKSNKWIRLRTNGIESTLTIKEIKNNKKIDGTDELEICVSDFNKANEILRQLGYIPRNYQENYRKKYILKGVKLFIDSWPLIPTYVEIEGDSEEEILNILHQLGYSLEDATTLDVKSIYEKVYGIDIIKIKELKFGE